MKSRNASAAIAFAGQLQTKWQLQTATMTPRAYHLILFADYVIGACFSAAVLVFGLIFFSLTGPIHPYEARALGGVYTGLLARVETGARELRTEYCAQSTADIQGCVAQG